MITWSRRSASPWSSWLGIAPATAWVQCYFLNQQVSLVLASSGAF